MAEKIRLPKKRKINDLKSKDFINAPLSNIDIVRSKIKDDMQVLKSDLESLIVISQKSDNHLAAVMNCRKLNELESNENTHQGISHKSNRFVALCNDLKKVNEIKIKEEEKINATIAQLKNIINIDEDIAPELEILPLSELEINNNDLSDMLEIANDLLELNGVQQKQCVLSSAVFVSKSGKATPIKVASHIGRDFSQINQLTTKELENNPLSLEIIAKTEYNLSEFDDDPIENAFIEDIIPYNYEIKEIEINDEKINHQPQKHLRKEGLQLGWKISDLGNKESVSIKYHLRPRVSRTIILPNEEEVSIIRTHSNIKDIKESQLSYKTNLVFNNDYHQKLDSVVMEDLVPKSYLFDVEEKKTGFFSSSKETSESFVKWRISGIPVQESTDHEYELTELNTVEEMKIEAFNILQIDLSKLSPTTRYLIEKKQNDARRFLAKFE